jgi:hypothetical protein
MMRSAQLIGQESLPVLCEPFCFVCRLAILWNVEVLIERLIRCDNHLKKELEQFKGSCVHIHHISVLGMFSKNRHIAKAA